MADAENIASKQKQISISEFFEKNKHFLGFDTLQRAVITAVKEAVDNSLDACEEARILPTIKVEINKLKGDKLESDSSAVHVDLGLDTRKNKATKSNEIRDVWFEDGEEVVSGLKIKTVMKAKYQRGRQSVHQYLRMTSIVNPHSTIQLIVRDADGEIIDQGHWIRTTEKLPRVVEEIKPHPHGIHLGQLQRMLKESDERKLTSFLRHNFSGVSMRAAKEILDKAELEEGRTPVRIKADEAQALLDSFQEVKLLAPPTDCLSPIEEILIKKGLSKAIDSRFASTVTRKPAVSQGNPFQIEVGLVFGGDLAADGPIEVLRFANRVPLMYQQGGCLLTKAIESIDWRRYGLEQPGGKGVPKGPAAILVHLASTNVQFTSEAKEAVSDNEEVHDELRRALFEVGRGLQSHRKRVGQREKSREKFDLINKILPEIASKS
ncbi:MAG: DNA topoisomerase VI subunit B, partial [Euryarchaeota archaeon]|nr:DNA topoisomerase VI subunit B [Euryarchaeota archaeon]